MIYAQDELIDLAKERKEIPNADVEARAFYWYIRCIIAEFQLGRIDRYESERLKADAISQLINDEKVSFFRLSELAYLAESWQHIDTLVEAYRNNKTIRGADLILAALYNTEEVV